MTSNSNPVMLRVFALITLFASTLAQVRFNDAWLWVFMIGLILSWIAYEWRLRRETIPVRESDADGE